MELYPICDEEFKIEPNIWYSVTGNGESPFMRVGHTCIHVTDESNRGKLLFIGGANPSECFNDIYSLDLNNLNWDKFVDLANFETGRYEHACFKSDKSVFIFGGADQEKNYNDVISFDVNTNTCENFQISSSTYPSARTFHAGITFKDKLIVFAGGETGKLAVQDSKIYILDPIAKKWISLSPKGAQPEVRHGHLMINKNEELIYLHGGMSSDTIYDDLWALDLKTIVWTKISFKHEDPKPCARAAHGGISVDKSFFVFGGIDSSNNALNDLWKYDSELNQWSIIDIFGYKPPPRLDFAYCKVKILYTDKSNDDIKKLKNFFVIHGGMDNEGNIFDDCFIINFS